MITVKNLIEKLSQLNPEMEIVNYNPERYPMLTEIPDNFELDISEILIKKQGLTNIDPHTDYELYFGGITEEEKEIYTLEKVLSIVLFFIKNFLPLHYETNTYNTLISFCLYWL